MLAILLIGMGGSVIKPCISGTVQKTSGTMATLGFAIFYMVINIGSLFGRGTAYVVRTRSSVVPVVLVVLVCALAAAALILLARWSAANRERRGTIATTTLGSLSILAAALLLISWVLWLPSGQPSGGSGSSLSYIFAVATAASIVAFFVVLLFYHEPAVAAVPAKPKRSVGRILLDMVLVLKSRRFTFFLLVISGFFFLYNQVYNVLPLYVKRVVEMSPAMDLYTAANPFVIVCFQLLITSMFGKMRPIRSMIIGSVGISLSMVVNLIPVFASGGVRALVANWLPIGSVFVILTVALIAFGGAVHLAADVRVHRRARAQGAGGALPRLREPAARHRLAHGRPGRARSSSTTSWRRAPPSAPTVSSISTRRRTPSAGSS